MGPVLPGLPEAFGGGAAGGLGPVQPRGGDGVDDLAELVAGGPVGRPAVAGQGGGQAGASRLGDGLVGPSAAWTGGRAGAEWVAEQPGAGGRSVGAAGAARGSADEGSAAAGAGRLAAGAPLGPSLEGGAGVARGGRTAPPAGGEDGDAVARLASGARLPSRPPSGVDGGTGKGGTERGGGAAAAAEVLPDELTGAAGWRGALGADGGRGPLQSAAGVGDVASFEQAGYDGRLWDGGLGVAQRGELVVRPSSDAVQARRQAVCWACLCSPRPPVLWLDCSFGAIPPVPSHFAGSWESNNTTVPM